MIAGSPWKITPRSRESRAIGSARSRLRAWRVSDALELPSVAFTGWASPFSPPAGHGLRLAQHPGQAAVETPSCISSISRRKSLDGPPRPRYAYGSSGEPLPGHAPCQPRQADAHSFGCCARMNLTAPAHGRPDGLLPVPDCPRGGGQGTSQGGIPRQPSNGARRKFGRPAQFEYMFPKRSSRLRALKIASPHASTSRPDASRTRVVTLSGTGPNFFSNSRTSSSPWMSSSKPAQC